MKNKAILLSGGMDSVVLLYEFKEQIKLAISFNAGQRNFKNEIVFAKKHCEKLEIEHIIVDISDFFKIFNSSILNHSNLSTNNISGSNFSTVLPFRNGVFASLAGAICEEKNLSGLFISLHFGDFNCPDTKIAFLNSMNLALKEGTYNRIEVIAPYIKIDKREIVSRAKKLNIPYEESWSCFEGRITPCEKCQACIDRKEALA